MCLSQRADAHRSYNLTMFLLLLLNVKMLKQWGWALVNVITSMSASTLARLKSTVLKLWLVLSEFHVSISGHQQTRRFWSLLTAVRLMCKGGALASALCRVISTTRSMGLRTGTWRVVVVVAGCWSWLSSSFRSLPSGSDCALWLPTAAQLCQ